MHTGCFCLGSLSACNQLPRHFERKKGCKLVPWEEPPFIHVLQLHWQCIEYIQTRHYSFSDHFLYTFVSLFIPPLFALAITFHTHRTWPSHFTHIGLPKTHNPLRLLLLKWQAKPVTPVIEIQTLKSLDLRYQNQNTFISPTEGKCTLLQQKKSHRQLNVTCVTCIKKY